LPVRFHASDGLSLSVVCFEGIVSDEEFRRVVPLIEDTTYNTMRRTLVDTTAATRSETPGELIRSTARTASTHVDEKVADGTRIALAAPGDEFFGLGRMYQALRDHSPVEVGVFRSLGAAEAWLELPPDYRDQLTEVPLPSRASTPVR
jgi:hypothetical protein